MYGMHASKYEDNYYEYKYLSSQKQAGKLSDRRNNDVNRDVRYDLPVQVIVLL